MITGKDIVKMGYEPGIWFKEAIEIANRDGLEGDALRAFLDARAPSPKIPLKTDGSFHKNIRAENNSEQDNVDKVFETMHALVRTPTITAASVMPDACPAGPIGTIPVGGVAVAKNAIHPGMHSADICCSVMVTEFDDVDAKDVMDAIHKATHFGPGGRPNGQRYTVSPKLVSEFQDNAFLSDKKIMQAAHEMMGTQGDGNHFAFVGTSNKTGKVCLVTHHGSRGPGAGLYKLGMRVAEKIRRKLSPETLKGNAWIPFDTQDGQDYWAALQIIRKWTKANHNCLHTATAEISKAKVGERFWNEHNFVFRDGDDFYHAKGATPVDVKFLPDTNGVQIVPLNMAEPILLVKGETKATNLGFAPHGAGRNFSRSAHKRAMADRTEQDIFVEETKGLDVRFFKGHIDISELPSAYKSANTVRKQIEDFDLAEVVDEIVPFGSIMAGDWERDMPWRKSKKSKRKK